MTIIILWGTLFSLNRGVNALTRATIDIIQDICPNENIIVVGSGKSEPISFEGIKFYPMPGILNKAKLLLKVNIIGSKSISNYFDDARFLDVSLILDLSEGDSFTDSYGYYRFFSMTISKIIFMRLAKRYVLLPQTIGPFSNRIFEKIAASVIRRCDTIIARDLDSKIYAEKISGRDCLFCYDMAFALKPKCITDFNDEFKGWVGINVSGLLWDGGYTGNNQFNLKVNYQNLITEIATFFLNQELKVVLIPHTYGGSIEDDLVACKKLKDLLEENGNYVGVITESYSERELKWIISRLEFFVGSRMHSCIAALSTGIPAVGIAYSRKFKGVYASIGVSDLVLDMRLLDQSEIMQQIGQIYANSDYYRIQLIDVMPPAINSIPEIIDSLIRG